MLCHARLPGKGRNFNIPNGPTDPKGKRAQIGLFDRGRFFALTGRLYDQSPLTVADHQKTIEWLLHRMQPQNWRNAGEPEADSRELTDPEIIERAHRATNGRKFEKLWTGEWEPDYASQSEADLALCCILAFWCGPSPSRINALFRMSGLVRREVVEPRRLSRADDSGCYRANDAVPQSRKNVPHVGSRNCRSMRRPAGRLGRCPATPGDDQTSAGRSAGSK